MNTSVNLSPSMVAALSIFFQRTDVHIHANINDTSFKDPVTGMFHYYHLYDVLSYELQRSSDQQKPVGVIVLNADNFKQVSDRYGNNAGETLLRVLGTFLQMGIRSEDIACRYGEEEFILILPGASLIDTQRRAEVLCHGARQLHLQYDDQDINSLTVSVGVACFPQHGSSAKELIDAAAQAMLRASDEGQNRVVVHSKPDC
jgi:diguanylate cyclase (GGDEF)-like protein